MLTMCKSTLLGGVILMLASTTPVRASHDCTRQVLHAYKVSSRQLNAEFHERRHELRRVHQKDRECVLSDIRAAAKRLRGYERAAVLKELHAKLREIDRCYHHQLRAVRAEINERRSSLRREREIALRSCQNPCAGSCPGEPPFVRPEFEPAPRYRPAPPRQSPPIPGPPVDPGYESQTIPNGYYARPAPLSARKDPIHYGNRDRDSSTWQDLLFGLLASRFNW